jgi:hypothetical protein
MPTSCLMSVSADGGGRWSPPTHAPWRRHAHRARLRVAVRPGGRAPVRGGWTAGTPAGRRSMERRHGTGHGAMTLRAGGLDWEGRPLPEFELDGRTCDCCPTAAASGPHGVTVLYPRPQRGGDSRHPRRHADGRTAGPRPVPVAEDGWEMPACPVNGPALAAHGERLGAAWFTAAGGASRACARPSRPTAAAAGGRPFEVAAGATAGPRGGRHADPNAGGELAGADPAGRGGALPAGEGRPPAPGPVQTLTATSAREAPASRRWPCGTAGWYSPGPWSASPPPSPAPPSPCPEERLQPRNAGRCYKGPVRSAAMRSSSGGWVMNSRLKPEAR